MLSTRRFRRRDRQEHAKPWAHTNLRGFPTLSAEEEAEETLAAVPKPEQVKKGKPAKE